MDATCIKAVEAYTKSSILGDDTPTPAAILIGQSDVGGPGGRREMDELERVCLEAGAVFSYVTDDLAEGRMLLQARRAVLTSLEVLGTWLTDDVCVPRTEMAALIAACAEISSEVGLTIGVVGHAGDGNMHPTIVFDNSKPGRASGRRGGLRPDPRCRPGAGRNGDRRARDRPDQAGISWPMRSARSASRCTGPSSGRWIRPGCSTRVRCSRPADPTRKVTSLAARRRNPSAGSSRRACRYPAAHHRAGRTRNRRRTG